LKYHEPGMGFFGECEYFGGALISDDHYEAGCSEFKEKFSELFDEEEYEMYYGNPDEDEEKEEEKKEDAEG
jgi:hypothetical protein